MTDTYIRDVARYLRDEYGVNPGKPVTGSNHRKFEFAYDGRPHVIVLHNPGHKTSSVDRKLADIRRELGPPPPKPERREKMMLRDMLPPEPLEALAAKYLPNPPHVATILHTVKCASYRPYELLVSMHSADIDRLFGDSGLYIIENDDGSWELHRDPSPNSRKFYRKNHSPNEYGQCYFTLKKSITSSFGMSPCDAAEVDGVLLVRSDPTQRRLRTQAPTPRKRLQQREKGQSVATTTNITQPDDAAPAYISAYSDYVKTTATTEDSPPLPISPRDRMVACLREIRAIEELGTHRLVKLTSGAWQFSPSGEVVKLED